jgi:hypothetical protein
MMILKSLYRLLKSIQLDGNAIIRSIIGFPRYLKEKRRYAAQSDIDLWPIKFYPMILDRNGESAELGEYFWQDLFVAKQVINTNPKRHIDVGSRIDGFVAHLACVRPIEVFDIRPLNSKVENVEFVQWDITNPLSDYHEIADCVTCLHTIEHIGLGRYGDPLDPDGWKKGLESLGKLLKRGGEMWLSVPIGKQRVEFNAHRVFDPRTIAQYVKTQGLSLVEFHYLDNNRIIKSTNLEQDMEKLSRENYSLGIFLFKEISI